MTHSVRSEPQRQVSKVELIALLAMLMATVAFSVDSMLPALPSIAEELTPEALNRAQLIVTSFVFGMGAGTFVTGPLSDRFGRKPVMIGGAVLYIIGALLAWSAQSLEFMLFARLIQGLGASGPRVVAMAIVRDLFEGRDMAKTMSLMMIVMTVVPALAPTIGAFIIAVGGWRSIFLVFVAFSVTSVIWLSIRQPETLAVEDRRTLKPADLWAATKEMIAHPTARLSVIVQMLCFGMLFSTISSIQQVFASYGKGETFHMWFGAIAVSVGLASVLNARIVGRIGMRPIIRAVLTAQIGLSAAMVAAVLAPLPQPLEFGIYVVWTASIFFQAGLTIGNLNALAMEPMGHIAGIAASIISAVSTVGAVIIAIPVGLSFNGTPLPLAASLFILSAMALTLTNRIRRESDE